MKPVMTEQANERSMKIDEMSALEIVSLMNEEDEQVARSVRQALPDIARAVEAIVERWQAGGRCLVVGAGTSGRLGVLDAAELEPTFSIERGRWKGFVAGGYEAMWLPLEENEDAEEAILQELREEGLHPRDVLIGVSASGSTPYVLGALRYAREKGSLVVSISCNQDAAASKLSDLAIEVQVGPEVIRGSTRLKAGTAQKMILNMLSTAVMVRLGKVYQNQMVEVQMINKKLVKRAAKTLEEVLHLSEEEALTLLESTGHDLKKAIFVGMTKGTVKEAEQYIADAQGRLKKAIHCFFNK